jgi:hypothetical protein
MGTESQGCRSIRCVGAAGPRTGSEAGPAQWGRSRHGPLGPECRNENDAVGDAATLSNPIAGRVRRQRKLNQRRHEN